MWLWAEATPASPVPVSPPLVWHSGKGFRYAALPVPQWGRAGFSLLAPSDTGVTFSNRLSDATVARNRLYEIGSGVALGDVDGDGWVDIYLCGLENHNVLYRNLGNWHFADVTARAGVACRGQFSTGCVLADIDGDGDLDLLVNSLGGGTRAFLNDGTGRFTEWTDSGLIRALGATSMALADITGNGALDLYVANYRTDTFFDRPPGLSIRQVRRPDGSIVIEPSTRFVGLTRPDGTLEAIERGQPDILYIHAGKHFVPIRWDTGLFLDEDGHRLSAPYTDWGLSVMLHDLNGDGLPDLYVCNDFVYWPDRIWLNESGKRFRAAPRMAFRCTSLASMTAAVADINRDGRDDIFVADMLNPHRESRAWQRPDTLADTVVWPKSNPAFRPEEPRNTLQLARDDGTYAEIARLAGVAATDWTWSAAFVDVDLDGWEDLLLATGSNHDVQDADAMSAIYRFGNRKTPAMRREDLARLPHRAAPSLALRNRHDLTFEDRSAQWGFNAVGVAQGMALADLDNDGDLDVVINCLNAPARVYRNLSNAPRIAVRLKGIGANTRGIGAKIRVFGGPSPPKDGYGLASGPSPRRSGPGDVGRPVPQSQEMICGGRYLSGDDALRVFAAGSPTNHLQVEVTWRSGRVSRVEDARANCLYEIDEAGAELSGRGPKTPPDRSPRPSLSLFQDVSARLHHVDVDAPFDDFARQPLLPRKLSTLGPGVCWADVDGDGRDDLLLGAGKGGRLAVFRNAGDGTFTDWSQSPLPKVNPRDETGVLVRFGADGIPRVILGESNWEDADPNTPMFSTSPLKAGTSSAVRSCGKSQTSATGPLALADVDGDGRLDLFVGGRVTAGRYPEPADSYLFRGTGQGFVLHQKFPRLGLVSGAVFTDFDGDGDPDLALACEWDSIRLFRNDQGKLTEITGAVGLSKLKGWWNGIAAGDFDGDGRMDLVVSNWGRNWRTDAAPPSDTPVRLYYGEFAGNGVVQTLLASIDPQLSIVTPWRSWEAVTRAIPSVAARLPTHHLYGRASVAEVLGPQASAAHQLEATTFDSMVLLNRGDHFEARPLPIEAQFAPAFGVSVADFDGDGNQDLFLAQNFFGTDAETARQDAGTGLVLLGDGHGHFRALGPREAGFALYGEQRGSAVADFDGDGRVDLVVAQHAGPVRLLRNLGGAPGVRIRLRGPQENPTAVGAVVRVRRRDGFGPAQEIHAGSGYWSQDSATLVFAGPSPPLAVRVRWPGGRTQEWSWPKGAQAVELSTNGLARF